jgi:hypothetical protein
VVAIGKRPVARKKLARGNELVTRRADATKKGGVVGREDDYALREGRRAASWMGLVRQRPPTSGSVPSVEEAGPAARSPGIIFMKLHVLYAVIYMLKLGASSHAIWCIHSSCERFVTITGRYEMVKDS